MPHKISRKIKQITDRIVKTYKPEKIILFGSYATDNINRWSDVDLAVIKKTSTRFYDRIGETLKVLRSIEGKPPLDIVVYTPEEFNRMTKESYFVRDEILKKGKVLYG